MWGSGAFGGGKCPGKRGGGPPSPRHYNQLGESEELRILGKASRTLTTFLVRKGEGGKAEITREDVLCFASGQKLDVKDGEGYVITAGKRKVGLVFRHHDVGNAADYNGIQGVYGLGRTMVCDLSGGQQDMTVLQW